MKLSRRCPLLAAAIVVIAVGQFACGEDQPQQHSRRNIDSLSRPPDLLSTLPYLSAAVDPHGSESGVLIPDTGRAMPGFTLFGPRTEPAAYLVRLDGDVVWDWKRPDEPEGWQQIHVLPDGGLLALSKDRHVERLDADSNLVWRAEMRAHHDFWVEGDRMWVLDRVERIVPQIHATNPTLADRIRVLDIADGSEIKRIEVLDALFASPYRFLMVSPSHVKFPADWGLDVLHTNHVEVLADSPLSERSEIFRAGNLLISMRNVNSIAVLNPDTLAVEWLWGPNNITFQHHPSLTDKGTILLFDNGQKQSQVIELDPLSMLVTWQYIAEGFYSALRGGAQRLPNGNTLITESDTGHIFEVTREGERIWELAVPFVDEGGKRAAVWRATRLERDQLPFLDGSRTAAP